MTFTIEIRGDSGWKPLVTKIKTQKEADRLLPLIIGQFIFDGRRYRVTTEAAIANACDKVA